MRTRAGRRTCSTAGGYRWSRTTGGSPAVSMQRGRRSWAAAPATTPATCVWAPPGDHARWVELGNPGWDFREQAPYLERAETQLRTRVPESEELTVLEASFMEAVDEIGLSLLEGLNGPEWGAGAAPIPKNMVGEVRWNSAFAYLDPVRARPNLTIRAEALVDRIVFDGSRPTAVLVRRGGRRGASRAPTSWCSPRARTCRPRSCSEAGSVRRTTSPASESRSSHRWPASGRICWIIRGHR